MMIGLALDLATSTGCAQGAVGDAAPATWTWDLAKVGAGHPARLGWFLSTLSGHLRAHPEITDVAIEAPVPLGVIARIGSNDDTQNMLRGLIGIAKAVAHLSGVHRIWQYDPKDCRQSFIGRRTFPKGTVKGHVLAACRLRRWDVHGEDQADAACMWDHWRAMQNPRLAALYDPVLRSG